jgi:hypothetical protein
MMRKLRTHRRPVASLDIGPVTLRALHERGASQYEALQELWRRGRVLNYDQVLIALAPLTSFQQDNDKTPCLMRFFDGELLAIFPTLPGNNNSYSCSCYAHVGQHGACDLLTVTGPRSRRANPSEYKDLQTELESAPYGYRLKIFERRQPQWDAQRWRACHD